MGRKPVLGLVGACLTSVALAGCADNCCLWDRSPKKDTTVTSTAGGSSRTTGLDSGWRDSRAGSGGGSTFNNGTTVGSAGSTGTAGSSFTAGGSAGSSGSFGGAPSSPYPGSTSVREPAGSSSFDRTSSPTTTGPDVTGGRSTQPTNYNDATGSGASAASSSSALPPITPARPRTDDLAPAKSAKAPLVDPPSQPPPVADPPALKGGTADGLPPIPTPPSQKGLERPLPPIAPPTGSGSSAPQN
jgi:hypothetical protein